VSQSRQIAWLVFALIAIANYGNYYVYDSIGPVADLLERQRDFSDSQIGMLNAIYSLPNIVLVLLGGILVDRFGAARMMGWTAAVCLAGWPNDSYGASALNPAGYQPMMLYFFISGALGFGFAMMLWLTSGRRHHEAITHAQ
jgi:MFS family permease